MKEFLVKLMTKSPFQELEGLQDSETKLKRQVQDLVRRPKAKLLGRQDRTGAAAEECRRGATQGFGGEKIFSIKEAHEVNHFILLLLLYMLSCPVSIHTPMVWSLLALARD